MLIVFILDNKVELKYLPLGENTPKYVSANAPVNVGWVDENAPTTNLDITKYVTVNGDNSIVGDNKFIFDQEKQDCYYQNTDSLVNKQASVSSDKLTLPSVSETP